ncbi:protein of unknown function [Hyphomicrobium sp. 1Nfss2.1]
MTTPENTPMAASHRRNATMAEENSHVIDIYSICDALHRELGRERWNFHLSPVDVTRRT